MIQVMKESYSDVKPTIAPSFDRIRKRDVFQLKRAQACDPIFHWLPCFAHVKVRIPGLLPLCPSLSLKKSVEEMTT